MTPIRPVLRYHGGKWRLVPWIISHFPAAHGRYVEPFGGGASVLLRKKPSPHEVYNDLDQEIVNVFRVLRNHEQADRLCYLLSLTPYSHAEYDMGCEQVSLDDDPLEAARRTLTRSHMGYGNPTTGKYKTGFRSRYNMGGGNLAVSWAEYPKQIKWFVERLRTVTLECSEAADCIARYDAPETLFYVDPPYLPETRTAHSGGYRHEMTPDQHQELAGVLHGVRGMVVLSGYDSPMYRELYAGWRVVTCEARAEKAKPRTEVLWISPNAASSMAQRALY